MKPSASQKIRARLKHPVVDADGHWLENHPVFTDYVAEFAGGGMADRYRDFLKRTVAYQWHATPVEVRQRGRMRRNGWWGLPTRTADRTACMIPALYRDRLDAFGFDVSLIYPTLGFMLLKTVGEPDMGQALIRAYNLMAADMFRAHADRLIPAATISLDDPVEAIAQLKHAHSLGLKLMMMNGTVQRTLDADADWQPDAARRRVWQDGLGLDSARDYDPVWRTCMDLKVAVTVHTGSMGWADRNSPNNFVFNHIGHFAQSHHLTARSLFMGGVTERFPRLKIGFLEGGAGWACNLYADIQSHWSKRNRRSMHRLLKPTLYNRTEGRRLFDRYATSNGYLAKNREEILARHLDPVSPGLSLEELAEKDFDTDDFSRVRLRSRRDIARRFADNFYFGCEADDPMTSMAFNRKAGLRIKPVLGSDIGHFDVVDATGVLAEAWEMVEDGLMTENDLREFAFTNTVELHAGMNPDFFKGTVIEKSARAELARAKKRDFTRVKAH